MHTVLFYLCKWSAIIGTKLFITGVTFAVCVWALALPAPFAIVAAVFCVIGCVLVWLDK